MKEDHELELLHLEMDVEDRQDTIERIDDFCLEILDMQDIDAIKIAIGDIREMCGEFVCD